MNLNLLSMVQREGIWIWQINESHDPLLTVAASSYLRSIHERLTFMCIPNRSTPWKKDYSYFYTGILSPISSSQFSLGLFRSSILFTTEILNRLFSKCFFHKSAIYPHCSCLSYLQWTISPAHQVARHLLIKLQQTLQN